MISLLQSPDLMAEAQIDFPLSLHGSVAIMFLPSLPIYVLHCSTLYRIVPMFQGASVFREFVLNLESIAPRNVFLRYCNAVLPYCLTVTPCSLLRPPPPPPPPYCIGLFYLHYMPPPPPPPARAGYCSTAVLARVRVLQVLV